MWGGITDVPGIKIGHYTDSDAITGCTIVLCERGALGAVTVAGSAPGTRETDSLSLMSANGIVHGIMLSGGSAFGLDAAGGAVRYLEERGYGLDVGGIRVPIVPSAILFDLRLGNPKIRPGIEEGYRACLAANGGEVEEGSVGAGTGATVGKILGPDRVTKSGIGTASQKIFNNIIVGAIVAVNAVGDVVDPANGSILAGPRADGGGFVRTLDLLKEGRLFMRPPSQTNTTIGVVATNARLDRYGVNKLAQMACNGLPIAIRPVGTMGDGDAIFAVSYGDIDADLTAVGSVACEVVAEAIVRAVLKATSIGGIPAACDVAGFVSRG